MVLGIGVSLALIYVHHSDLAATIWGAVSLVYLELTIITAIAILFSSFSSPALSALFTFAIFVIGHFSKSLHEFAETLASDVTKKVFETVYYVMPNFSHFSFITNSVYGETPPTAMLGFAALYAVIYSTILVWAAVLIFKRRNFV